MDVRWCAVQVVSTVHRMREVAKREMGASLAGLGAEEMMRCHLRYDGRLTATATCKHSCTDPHVPNREPRSVGGWELGSWGTERLGVRVQGLGSRV